MFFSSSAVSANMYSNWKTRSQAGRIDVHHHILPPVYTSTLAKMGITDSGGVPFPAWNAQMSLDVMDKNGIAAAITSISAPGIYFGDTKFSKDLAKQCNEFSANLIRSNKKRFGGFAVLPLPDVKAAVNALDYAIDVLELDGVILLSNVDGLYPGHSRFDELYAELNHRKSVVFIHPTLPAYGQFPKMKRPASMEEFVFDTTRAISSLILNKTLKRFPNIRFIISHAGGTAPYIAWRMSLLDHRFHTDTINDLKKLYYDAALSASPYALRSLQELVNPSHILFGSDYPFAPEIITRMTISGLNNFDDFDEKTLSKINRENALDLFPRFVKKQVE